MRLVHDIIVLNRIVACSNLKSAWRELSENAFSMQTYGEFGRTLSQNLQTDACCFKVIRMSAKQHLKKISSGECDTRQYKPTQDLEDGQRGVLELMEKVWRENENF